jgi:NADPH-dependent curcumin reductase CurA
MTQMKSVVLARRPNGNPVAEDFQVQVSDLPSLKKGELLCRNHFVSLDAGILSRD